MVAGRRRPRQLDVARGDAARRGRATLTFQARWNIEDCGPDACDYAYVEVDDGTGYKADRRARSPSPPRATASTASRRTGTAGDVRPVGLRRQDDQAALPLPHRRRGAGHGPGPDLPGLFVDEIKVTRPAHDGVHRRRRERRRTAGRSTASAIVGASESTLYDNYYVASNRSTSPTTATCSPGRTTSASRTGRTGWSTSPTRTACSSPTGTPRSRTTTTSQHPGQGEILPIDAHPSRSTASTASRGAAGSRPTTRRSRWRRRTRSRCTPTSRARQLHPRPGGPAAVRRQPRVLEPDAPDSGREGAPRGRPDPRAVPERHVDADPGAARSGGGRSRLAASGARCGGKSPPHRSRRGRSPG